MKVMQENEGFRPITVKIDSKDEFDYFLDMLNGGLINIHERNHKFENDELITVEEMERVRQTLDFGEDLYEKLMDY